MWVKTKRLSKVVANLEHDGTMGLTFQQLKSLLSTDGPIDPPDLPPLLSASGYPLAVFLVTVANQNNLQTELNARGAVRLEAGGNYTTGALSALTIASDQKVYGLPDTKVPLITVLAGTTGAVLSRLFTEQITFQAGASITGNLFRDMLVWGMSATNAVIEGNLFLGLNGPLNFNMSSTGRLRNNRFFRVVTHNQNTLLQGNATTPSYRNTFVAYNALTAANNPFLAQAQGDVTIVGIDAESWAGGAGNGAVIQADSACNAVRVFCVNGGDGRSVTPPPHTGYYDIDAPALLIINDVASSHNDAPYKTHLGPNLSDAVMLGIPTVGGAGQVLDDDSGGVVYTSTTPTDADISLTGPQAASLRAVMVGLSEGRAGQPWGAPVFDTLPDIGGAGWATGRGAQADDSPLIQALIDAYGIAELDAGVYYIGTTLFIGEGEGIIGAGWGQTLLIAKTSSVDMIRSRVNIVYVTQAAPTSFVLSDLQLQGGLNGLHMDIPGAGDGAQLNQFFLSHVVFRDMSNAGIFLDGIYAADNAQIDHLGFVDCPRGFILEIGPDGHLEGDQPGLCYVDKVTWVHCQWIRCTIAVDMPCYRGSNLVVFVENLFKDCSDGALLLQNCDSFVFANSQFENNGGTAVVTSNRRTSFVSPVVIAGPEGATSVFACEAAVEGGIIRTEPGDAGTVVFSNTADVRSLYNCDIDMPLGTIANGYLFNNYIPGSATYNKEGVIVKSGVATAVLNTALAAAPLPQLLWGDALSFR